MRTPCSSSLKNSAVMMPPLPHSFPTLPAILSRAFGHGIILLGSVVPRVPRA